MFKKYKRIQIAELREVNSDDILLFERDGKLQTISSGKCKAHIVEISISEFDKANGSPKIGDMIARNPENYCDMWLIAEQYFKNNFEEEKPQ